MNSDTSLKALRKLMEAGPPYEAAFLDALHTDPRAGAQALYQQCQRRMARIEAEADRLEAMLRYEREGRELGFQCIAGVDEAGRGPLAGPVVAGAVVLAEPLAGLNDSKQLSEAQRESLFEQLQQGEHCIGLGVVEAWEIDQLGIQSANYRAMAKAVEALTPSPDYLLVDGFNLPGVVQPQLRLVKGDSRSLSIAAASIIAKVSRDRTMYQLDAEYPGYEFGLNKGYGTKAHIAAIERLGPCPAHRKSFAPISQRLESGDLFEF